MLNELTHPPIIAEIASSGWSCCRRSTASSSSTSRCSSSRASTAATTPSSWSRRSRRRSCTAWSSCAGWTPPRPRRDRRAGAAGGQARGRTHVIWNEGTARRAPRGSTAWRRISCGALARRPPPRPTASRTTDPAPAAERSGLSGMHPGGRLATAVATFACRVTDRCNFRCTYCMPRELFGPDHAFLPRAELLTFEEITRVVAAFAALGVDQGPPDRRRAAAAPRPARPGRALAAIPGIDDLALTTNGALLAGQAARLRARRAAARHREPGRARPEIFARMADTPVPSARCWTASTPPHAAGSRAVKLNTVVQRGVNDVAVVPLARFARDRGVDRALHRVHGRRRPNGWRRDEVVPAAEIVARVARRVRRSSRCRAAAPGRSRSATATATAAGRSASSPPSPPLLRRPASAPACPRRRALHLPVRDDGPRPARVAARRRDDAADRASPALGGPRRPLLRAARGRDRPTAPVEMSYIGG